MCTFCVQHGNRDEKWYFNFNNYLFDKIFPTPEEKAIIKEKREDILSQTDKYGDLDYAQDADFLRVKVKTAPGQVITTEEANKIMDIAEEATKREDSMVVLARCNCALAYRGKIEYRCIVFGMPVTWAMELGYARYPKEGLTEFGGAEWSELRKEIRIGQKVPLKPEEARELMNEWAHKGLYHTVVSRGVFPLIDGICNCEAPYCRRIRNRTYHSIDEWLVKGHYVGRIDPQKCTSCRNCMEKCQFGALRVSAWSDIAVVDPTKCSGCGLCRYSCENDAITMVPREKVPVAKDLW